MNRLFYTKAVLFPFAYCSNSSLFGQNTLSFNIHHTNTSVGSEYMANRLMFGSMVVTVRQPAFNTNTLYMTKKGLLISYAPFISGNSNATSSKTKAKYDIET